MSNRRTATAEEVADRLGLHELVDAFSRFADRRDPQAQAALFSPDGRMLVFDDDPKSTEPPTVLAGRLALAQAFSRLDTFEQTTHLNGQSTFVVDGDTASGESYCLVHQISAEDGQRSLFVMAVRYLDNFVKADDVWYFTERNLHIDWTDSRPLS